MEVYDRAQNLGGVPKAIIKDEARTELAKPAYTAVAIGPARGNVIDLVTGKLKLL